MAQPDAAQIGIAFALVLLAGLCAPLGACVVVFMRKTHTHLLATSIALAAGVMLFVSLTEVLGDSITEVRTTGWADPLVHTVTYLAFFAGVVLCGALDWFTEAIMRLIARHRDASGSSSAEVSRSGAKATGALQVARLGSSSSSSSAGAAAPACKPQKGCQLADLEAGVQVDLIATPIVAAGPLGQPAGAPLKPGLLLPEEAMDAVVLEAAEHLVDDNCAHLARTCILVWLALSLHNLPEGLATFVGYMSSPHLGITVAVAIAVHNIPEGIALGVPIYFATGSRWKAIGWTAVSGAAEPLGALIGLAVQLGGRLNPVAMGIIMSLVAGIMTGIALQELLPRAMSFDPSNRFATYGVFGGMAIMAVSLVLLSFLDPTA